MHSNILYDDDVCYSMMMMHATLLYNMMNMYIGWWWCIPLCYDMIHFMMIMHVIMAYTLWCWWTPIQYGVHAYHSVMMLSYALWCILDVDDAYTVHTEMMMMYIWWWGCIPYDNDTYLWWWCMTMHALCSVKAENNYLFINCVWWGVQWCVHE